jgi:hypothetical protein
MPDLSLRDEKDGNIGGAGTAMSPSHLEGA